MRIIRDRSRSVDLDEFLSRPLFGYLATASDAGSRVSPVWFLWEEEAIWIIGNRETDSFPARIERDSRSAFAIVDFDRKAGSSSTLACGGEQASCPSTESAQGGSCIAIWARTNQWDAQRFIRAPR
jgi:hypothetical protein